MTLSRLFKRLSVSRPRQVEIGWLVDSDKATFIWDGPRKFSRDDPKPAHAKSVNYCPAVLDHEARLFEVPCPIDLNLRFQYDPKTQAPQLVNAAGDQSTIRPKHLDQMIALVARKEWRHPDKPILQLITPYLFLSDEPVYMTQLPPFCHYRDPAWPGALIGGRFPIHVWPRHMMWAFEWHDTAQPLILKRGEPWFYVRFETFDPSRPVRMVEAQMTEPLKDYLKGLSAVSNYVNRTFSLFSVAKKRRPKTLLKAKTR